MHSVEWKFLKPHTDVAKNMQCMAVIYIPGFYRVQDALNSGPKGLMTRQNLNVYFYYLNWEILQKRHMNPAWMSWCDILHGAPHKDYKTHKILQFNWKVHNWHVQMDMCQHRNEWHRNVMISKLMTVSELTSDAKHHWLSRLYAASE